MVEALVIMDGASEPVSAGPTSLERARTPCLDALARAGRLTRLRTTPPGLPAGSETAIPVLLGWVPQVPVDRGAVEAAARDIPVPAGHRVWRIDVTGDHGDRAGEDTVTRVADELRAALPRHAVLRIGGHRLLVTGPRPLPLFRRPGLRIWPEGALPPVRLGGDTVMIAAHGAASGIARLMGASVCVPGTATGVVESDLGAKAMAALDAVRAGARRVVVHVGGPDEAAHLRDPDAKAACIERIDSEIVAPLAALVADSGGTLVACPDHNCDPRTGAHDDAPVPLVTWRPADRDRGGEDRLTERAVASLDVSVPPVAWAAA